MLQNMLLPCALSMLVALGETPVQSLDEIQSRCLAAGQECGACDGLTVTTQGAVDPVNIIDKSQYPQLPYQKFRIADGESSLEVWVATDDDADVFRRVRMAAATPGKQIVLRGRLECVRMLAQGAMRFGLKLNLERKTDLLSQ